MHQIEMIELSKILKPMIKDSIVEALKEFEISELIREISKQTAQEMVKDKKLSKSKV